MKEIENEEDKLKVLIKIKNKPSSSQRMLAAELGFSLGKLNYCIKALKQKGLIKINNFKKNKNRFNPKSKNNYLYILTPKGIAHKTELAINFLEKKSKEYNEIKKELIKEDRNKLD